MKLKTTYLVSCAMWAALMASSYAVADDFTVTTGTTSNLTNGGNTLDGNDTLSVENGATIDAINIAITATNNNNHVINNGDLISSDNFAGVNFSGTDNSFTNNGSLTSMSLLGNSTFIDIQDGTTVTNNGEFTFSGGDFNTGIGAQGSGVVINNTSNLTGTGDLFTTGIDICACAPDAVVMNSGTIDITSNFGAAGIVASDGATITNSGDIFATGDNSIGIFADSNNMIDISGQIVTNGDRTFGIETDDDNTIDVSGDILVSGSNGVGVLADDRNTLTVSGKVEAVGDIVDAIDVADNNNITISGSVSTNGADSDGIIASDSNMINVTGTITSIGDNSEAIDFLDLNTVNVSGDITTDGAFADGIDGSDNNVVTVSGNVTTRGDDSDALDIADDNTLTAGGTFQTFGVRSAGLDFSDRNIAVFSGMVSTSGTESHGIDMGDGNNVTSRGMINVTGTDAHGIIGVNSNTVKIFGKVQSTQGDFVHFTGANNRLEISGSTFLQGSANLGTDATVEIDVDANLGNGLPVYWDFSGSGINPTFTFIGSGGYTFDQPTLVFSTLSSGNDLTISTTDPNIALTAVQGLSELAQEFSFNSNRGATGFASQSNFSPSDPFSKEMGADVWLSGYLSDSSRSAFGTRSASDTDFSAATLGLNFSSDNSLEVGVLASNFSASTAYSGGSTVEVSGVSFGAFARKTFDNDIWLDLGLALGRYDGNGVQLVNHNLGTNGLATLNTTHNTNFVTPEVGVGRSFDLGTYEIRPSLKLRYTNQKTRDINAILFGTATPFSRFTTTTKEAVADLTILRSIENWDLTAGMSLTRRNTESDLTTTAGARITSNETISSLKLGTRYHATDKIDLHGFIGISQGTDDYSSVSGGVKVSMKF